MIHRLSIYLLIAAFTAMTISGCGTVPKKTRQEISDIKSRVETLETKVESVETRQAELAEAQKGAAGASKYSAEEAVLQPGTNISIMPKSAKGKERTKDIQTALKNAGFYSGNIDGVKGRKTTKAIKDFQKANGLNADGIVGAKTWAALAAYSGDQAAGAATRQGVDK